MRILSFPPLLILSTVLMFGCTPASARSVEGSATATAVTAIEVPSFAFELAEFPQARSHALEIGPDGSLYLAYGVEDSLFVVHSVDGGKTFSEPVLGTGDALVHILPIEHPAIAVGTNGRVGIAWLEMPPDFHGASVWLAVSKDSGRTFQPAQVVATEPDGEVAMVEIAFDADGNPVLTWLRDSELRFTRSSDGGGTFSEPIGIGQRSCECCQPQAVSLGDDIYIAYRSLEPGIEEGDIRDIVVIHSGDAGQTFGAVTRVSDEHWYLPACPIAGPSLAVHDGNFYIAWMDGRAEPAGTFRRGDIWLASSHDAGVTFSPNIRINATQEKHHTLPAVAVGPGGRIHVAWEAQAQDSRSALLYYSISDDGGQTFAPPRVMADNTDSARGNPGKPLIVVNPDGQVALTWLDRRGVQMARWKDPE